MGEMAAGLKRRLGNGLARPLGPALPFLVYSDGAKRPSLRALVVLVFCVVGLFATLNTVYALLGGAFGFGWSADPVVLRSKAVHHVSLECGVKCSPHRLLILQTSDGGSHYANMLDTTQDVQLTYAMHWKYSYLRWDGIARGTQSWMATYNRIYLLRELYQQGRYHWVLFLDPDAIFRDVAMGVEDLLDDQYAVIGCRGGEDPVDWWDINIGVAFFNLKHPDIGRIISRWYWSIAWTPSYKMHKSNSHEYIQMTSGPPVKDDQQMFHGIVKAHPRGPAIIKRYFGEDSELFNYGTGRIISHLIRADNKDQNARLAKLQELRDDFFAKMGRKPAAADVAPAAKDGSPAA